MVYPPPEQHVGGANSQLPDPNDRRAMSDSQCSLFSPEYYRSITVEARPERLSSDAGALLMRELMDRLGVTALLERHLSDKREEGRLTRPFRELLRTSLLLLSQGWSAHHDATLLRADPALRLAVSDLAPCPPILLGALEASITVGDAVRRRDFRQLLRAARVPRRVSPTSQKNR